MSKELAVIGCIWFVNPAFSLNLGDNQALATIPYVVRNLLLMLRSSLVPIIYSYKNKPLFQPLTSDLLNSLELILQNAVTLEAFEEFLRLEELTTTLSFGSGLNTGSGLTMLEFYLKCRLHADKGDRVWAESIFSDYLETKNIQVPADIYLDIENGDFLDLNLFNKAEDHVINMLKTYYYPKFVVSDQYIFLRRLIHRQEIYTYRLMQTSMHEYQANNNKKVNIDCDDWHTQSLD